MSTNNKNKNNAIIEISKLVYVKPFALELSALIRIPATAAVGWFAFNNYSYAQMAMDKWSEMDALASLQNVFHQNLLQLTKRSERREAAI